MITDTTRDHRKASSIEEMQQIARNQIKFAIYELEERIANLRALSPQIESIVDDASLTRIASDVIDSGDIDKLRALTELGEYYETMKAGNYF